MSSSTLVIKYCLECKFLPRATKLQLVLQQNYPTLKIVLDNQGEPGDFDVFFQDEKGILTTLHSKIENQEGFVDTPGKLQKILTGIKSQLKRVTTTDGQN